MRIFELWKAQRVAEIFSMPYHAVSSVVLKSIKILGKSTTPMQTMQGSAKKSSGKPGIVPVCR
jgi:hypothetical protein